MHTPPIPDDEVERLQDLQALKLLDTPPEQRFDRITRLCRRALNVPVCLVSLVDQDRQWFKSKQGLEARETSREVSFCGHAINETQIMVVADARKDPRFADNPLVTGEPRVIFYAGYPLTTPTGSRIGTLCAIDHEPCTPDPDFLATLADAGALVEREIASIQVVIRDELTGVLTRGAFMAQAENALTSCRETRRVASVAFIDLNDFKAINDQLGHKAGDDVLRQFGLSVQRVLRDSDLVGRFGGDEFVLMLPNSSKENTETVIFRLRQHLKRLLADGELPKRLTISAGVVEVAPTSHEPLSAVVEQAHALMYEQKRVYSLTTKAN